MVDRQLEPDERIEWIGQPVPRFFTHLSFCLTAFLSFAIVVLSIKAYLIINLSGPAQILFLGICILLCVILVPIAPILTYWRFRRTVYVLTDRRAITIVKTCKTAIRSYTPGQLQKIRWIRRCKDWGDIVFDEESRNDSQGVTQTKLYGFLGVSNPEKVKKLVKQLAKKATKNKK